MLSAEAPRRTGRSPGCRRLSIKAMLSFILSCAARRARGDIDADNSMLVHVTRFTDGAEAGCATWFRRSSTTFDASSISRRLEATCYAQLERALADGL